MRSAQALGIGGGAGGGSFHNGWLGAWQDIRCDVFCVPCFCFVDQGLRAVLWVRRECNSTAHYDRGWVGEWGGWGGQSVPLLPLSFLPSHGFTVFWAVDCRGSHQRRDGLALLMRRA